LILFSSALELELNNVNIMNNLIIDALQIKFFYQSLLIKIFIPVVMRIAKVILKNLLF